LQGDLIRNDANEKHFDCLCDQCRVNGKSSTGHWGGIGQGWRAGASIGTLPIYVDPALAKPPKNAKRLSLKERYATVTHYLRPVLEAAPLVKPVSVGLFGGKLELYRLPLLQMLFVLLVIQAQPGDSRNWTAIRDWAATLRPELLENQLS
jgi:hypothetical protein